VHYAIFAKERRNGTVNQALKGVIKVVRIDVNDNNVEQAIRQLKKKLNREGFYREIKKRRFFEKPSEKRRREKAEASRRAHKAESKRQSSRM